MRKRDGFTLIELLVSMAILGLLLSLILALQTSTIRINTRLAASSRVMEEQNAAMTYIADRFRSSVAAYTSNLSLATGVTCSVTANTCVAFTVPEIVPGSDPPTQRCVMLAYNLENRTAFTERRPDTWADDNEVKVIREYRSIFPSAVTDPKCALPTTLPTTWNSAVVADGFTPPDGYKPFELVAGKQLVIQLRSAYSDNGTPRYYPPAGPAKLQAMSRNVSPTP